MFGRTDVDIKIQLDVLGGQPSAGDVGVNADIMVSCLCQRRGRSAGSEALAPKTMLIE